MPDQKRSRCIVFDVRDLPNNAQYFDADGNQIGGPPEPVRTNVSDGKVSIGPVPIDLAQRVTGVHNPSYFEVIKATSHYTGASIEFLDKMPCDDLIEFVRGAIQIRRKADHGGHAAADHGGQDDTLETIERNTPALDKNGGTWVSNKRAASLEGVETTTLKQYRYDGEHTDNMMFGRDKDGRIWRRIGKPNSHPWYLRSSLKDDPNRL